MKSTNTYNHLAGPRVPMRLFFSYIVDWIVIIGIAAIGAAFWKHTPTYRPFSPVDPDISFPYTEHEKVSTGLLFTIALVIPAVLTAVIALAATPNTSVNSRSSRGHHWRVKCWEWNVAWMGLALALATAFIFTEGMKTVIGKPRPDLLARCDLDPAVVNNYALGGLGGELPLWNLLVSVTSCRQKDKSKLDDGFQSFPSGHSSFSWAGMVYLALYGCAKLGMRMPYLIPGHDEGRAVGSAVSSRVAGGARRQAAAPPAYLFIVALLPLAVSTYVACSRFSDFRHHGFDILFGALLGAFTAWAGFRMYHLPSRYGAGWAWGPRSATKAWWIGVGVANYGEEDRNVVSKDIEMGGVAHTVDDENDKPMNGLADGHYTTRS